MKECCVARIDDLLIAKLLILCEQIAAAESLGSTSYNLEAAKIANLLEVVETFWCKQQHYHQERSSVLIVGFCLKCFRYSPKLVSWHRSLKFQRRQYRLWFLQSLAMPPCQHLLQSKRLFPKKYYLILV
ncbi:hypothetical protein O6H91_02G081400 [Diphasiastrum complanatum]|uniref:Uncharacterized protein n=1 Tax=Diphasiastrum complanatum TaxID=34168 RepID=A0ACC2EHM7_DIPCM|nr:hypothetical protein O6H91_02G081400 [Diphasiastrum complanatum]